MTERERLIKLVCRGLMKEGNNWKVENIADYLLENGVIVPPCKVGDNVWFRDDYHYGEITAIRVDDQNKVFCEWASYDYSPEETELWDDGEFTYEDIGKTVFLSKEEAEKALKGEENE